MPATASKQPAQRLKDSPMLPAIKRKALGRPSIYKPEYCGLIEQWGKEGKSQSQMCSLLNIGRATFHEWAGLYEDFGASVTRAKEHAQAWWEAKAQGSLGKKQFQAQLWRYSMMGRFKEDYAEQRSIDVTVSLEGIVGALQQREPPKVIEGASSLAPLEDPEKRKE
jgi:hypothetical protein